MNKSKQFLDLAQSMRVHPSDLKMLAQSVANTIAKDKADTFFISADEDYQVEMSITYALDAVKKFENFQNRYITNPSARDLFHLFVLSTEFNQW